MKINNIYLRNFGSYEGETIFETKAVDDRNIILIGGKNGAGKTTLFTAMRICLYGYLSMGYKNFNSFYIKAITKLINNNAKLSKPALASVSMEIELNNGQGMDVYTLTRCWELTDSLSEKFNVLKNDIVLNEDEKADFEKYLLSLMPPELFNLYFFDGEKIADFFLEEGSSSRIKEAFLTLCGYDTFDIMRRNFKRISGAGTNKAPTLDEYIATKEALSEKTQEVNDLSIRLNECITEINDCDAEIASIEKQYQQTGGISEEEWNKKLNTLKEEEKKRESYNSLIKKWANEIIPFLMLRPEIEQLKEQIDSENKALKYRYFCEVLEDVSNEGDIKEKTPLLKELALIYYGNDEAPILDLSIEQGSILYAQINQILTFEQEKIERCKKAIKRSLNLTSRIRQELENSSISSVQEYMKNRAQLFEQKSALLVLRVEMEEQLHLCQEEMSQIETKFAKVQSKLAEELKLNSINDISARAIVMLDKLQHVLYRKQIEKVENFFRKEICVLMRKTRFIDDIYIDDNFNTHIYRTEEMENKKLFDLLTSSTEEQTMALLGTKAIEKIRLIAKKESLEEIRYYIKEHINEKVLLPLEIDKTSLSNGEKQIFIMTLYHALVNLCNHEIPFVIDTPFARIDTEHRRNISKHFFSKLNGQVFILSTNEEINSSHVQILQDKICATYMLENIENKKTEVVRNSYFEV